VDPLARWILSQTGIQNPPPQKNVLEKTHLIRDGQKIGTIKELVDVLESN
jgi:hypothetical protein